MRSVLEALLNSRREGRFEVINGGTGRCYSTDQEYLSTSARASALSRRRRAALLLQRTSIPAWGRGGKPYFRRRRRTRWRP